MTHTPGPWTWGENFEGLYGSGRYNIILNHWIDEGMWLESGERQEANARLIAASPDLLEALEGMVENACASCNDGYVIRCTKEEWEAHVRATHAARAAIAKAKGEQP